MTSQSIQTVLGGREVQLQSLVISNDECISFITVVGHLVVFLDRVEGENISDSLGVVPDWLWKVAEPSLLIRAAHSCIAAYAHAPVDGGNVVEERTVAYEVYGRTTVEEKYVSAQTIRLLKNLEAVAGTSMTYGGRGQILFIGF